MEVDAKDKKMSLLEKSQEYAMQNHVVEILIAQLEKN
jgi:hypothetical protein